MNPANHAKRPPEGVPPSPNSPSPRTAPRVSLLMITCTRLCARPAASSALNSSEGTAGAVSDSKRESGSNTRATR